MMVIIDVEIIGVSDHVMFAIDITIAEMVLMKLTVVCERMSVTMAIKCNVNRLSVKQQAIKRL